MKLANLVYGLEDRPPAAISFLMGFQHICIYAISLVFPVLIVRAMGGGTEEAAFFVSMSLLAGGVGVVLQALKRGPVGSGYLCPQVCGPSFISASVLAAKTGGLSLVLGMTALAGVFESLFSRLIKRLRFLFPTEVTGLIVAMVGVTLVKLASLNFLGMDARGDAPDMDSILTGAVTLAIMIGLNVWTRGRLKLFCIVIAMAVGYFAAWGFGALGPEQLAEPFAKPLVWMPFLHHPGWSFDWSMIPPFVVAMLCSSLKSVGDLTTCQKINEDDWKRPDMENIGKGILADGLGCLAAGVLGGYGQSTSSTNIGLSIATGVTSRVVALFMGATMAVLAFCPALSTVFAIMPKPVIGATLIFSMSFMVVAGFQIIMSRMLDNRKTFVVGVSLFLGLMADVVPETFENLPELLRGVLSSDLSTATLSAILLNLLFRLGVDSKATIALPRGASAVQTIHDFMARQGAAWGARREVFQAATAVLTELVESILPEALEGDGIELSLSFNEYKLTADLRYKGRPVNIPEDPYAPVDPGDEDRLQSAFAWRIVQHYIKHMKQSEEGGLRKFRVDFEH